MKIGNHANDLHCRSEAENGKKGGKKSLSGPFWAPQTAVSLLFASVAVVRPRTR
jgi:hypothetical protein